MPIGVGLGKEDKLPTDEKGKPILDADRNVHREAPTNLPP